MVLDGLGFYGFLTRHGLSRFCRAVFLIERVRGRYMLMGFLKGMPYLDFMVLVLSW